VGGCSPVQSDSDKFHTRLQDLYKQSERSNIERDYIRLAKEWNALGSGNNVAEHRPQNDTVYAVEQEDVVGGGCLPAQSGSSDVHASLQGLLDYILLAREWNGAEIAKALTDVSDTNEQISK